MKFYDELVSWNNVTIPKTIILFGILLFIYWYIFVLMKFKTTSELINKISTYQNYKCLIPCEKEICIKTTEKLRDRNYLTDVLEQPDKCIFTFWEFTHVILHIFIGYFYNIYTSQFISISFEIFEHYVYNCGSILDLFYNLSGVLIGISIRSLMK